VEEQSKKRICEEDFTNFKSFFLFKKLKAKNEAKQKALQLYCHFDRVRTNFQ